MMGKITNALLGISFKKISIWLGTALIIVISIFFIRSCSRHRIVKKEVYFIGRDSSWYPMQLFGRERSLQAFTNDLLAAIAKEASFQFHWVETSSNVLIEGLNSGAYDAIISSVRPTILNHEQYLFSDLIYEFGPVLIVREDSPVISLEEMDGRMVGIKAGSNLIFNAIRKEGAHAFNLTLISYSNINRALEDLVNHLIDGVILDTISAYTYVEGVYYGKLKIVTGPFTDEGLRLMAKKGEMANELIATFDEELKKLKDNGTYESLIKKWNLIDPEKRYFANESVL